VTAYVDASVLLRVVLGQVGRLAEWEAVTRAVSSSLVRVECLRAIERLRLGGMLAGPEVASRRRAVLAILDASELVLPDALVLERASMPMPVPLGTLDAIHLSTALLWQELRGERLVLTTHDAALGTAAQAFGLEVLGLA
jgi:predicted nucleic acid-binding protein